MLTTSPIQGRVSSVFIPVRQIEAARDWYCSLLGITTPCEILNGHLCPIPTKGALLILDTMPKWSQEGEQGLPRYDAPSVMLHTDHIEASYSFVTQLGIETVTEIENGHWFVIKDLDGNYLMISS